MRLTVEIQFIHRRGTELKEFTQTYRKDEDLQHLLAQPVASLATLMLVHLPRNHVLPASRASAIVTNTSQEGFASQGCVGLR